jgi:hypothetical protein
MSNDVVLGEELVRIALGAAQHQPVLVWAYFGPPAWLDEARARAEDVDSLLARAERLRGDAEKQGDAFVAAQADAIAGQLEVMLGATPSYVDHARRLLGIGDPRPPEDAVEALRNDVLELARDVVGGHSPVERWENERGVTGEAKWDAAVETYVEGRRWVRENFPLPIVENLELGRDSDYHSSVHMNWKSGSTMRLGVNVDTPRTRATTRFEVAHNSYPGDYLRIAALSQHAYAVEGRVPACVKLKNAPESTISEGIEDVAYLRLLANPGPEDLLATKLEWLRRGVAVTAAIMVRDEHASTSSVADYCARQGFMGEARIANELRLIDHPVWGIYRASYWPGRELVAEADRRAARAGKTRDYLQFLFTELHTPADLLAGVDRLLLPTGRA